MQIIGLGAMIITPLIGDLSDEYGRKAFLTLPMTISIIPLGTQCFLFLILFFFLFLRKTFNQYLIVNKCQRHGVGLLNYTRAIVSVRPVWYTQYYPLLSCGVESMSPYQRSPFYSAKYIYIYSWISFQRQGVPYMSAFISFTDYGITPQIIYVHDMTFHAKKKRGSPSRLRFNFWWAIGGNVKY